MSEDQMPTPESLRIFIQTEWADVHHSRVQEWTALGVVAGVHFVFVQFVESLGKNQFIIPSQTFMFIAAFIAALFAVMGVLITYRHRHLMKVKLNWIFQAEDRLGLIRDASHDGIMPREDSPTQPMPWRGLSRPRPLSTSGLIVGFYLLLILVDLSAAIHFGLLFSAT